MLCFDQVSGAGWCCLNTIIAGTTTAQFSIFLPAWCEMQYDLQSRLNASQVEQTGREPFLTVRRGCADDRPLFVAPAAHS